MEYCCQWQTSLAEAFVVFQRRCAIGNGSDDEQRSYAGLCVTITRKPLKRLFTLLRGYFNRITCLTGGMD